MWQDLLVNGTSLSTVARIVSFDGILTGAPLRGDNLTYPGRAGDVYLQKVRGAYTFTVPLVLLGTSQADFTDKLSTLKRLVASGGSSLALTRQLTTGGGNVSQTATGDYLAGLEPALINLQTGRVALDLINLSGLWYGTELFQTFTSTTGTLSVGGDVATERIVVTLSGSTNPTVTNTANGYAFTYTGSTGTGVVVDAQAMTATQGSTDVTANLTWTKRTPFRLEVGSNPLTFSGAGTVQFDYFPAYL